MLPGREHLHLCHSARRRRPVLRGLPHGPLHGAQYRRPTTAPTSGSNPRDGSGTLWVGAGLTPPGGFWLGDDEPLGYRAGDPVLLTNYPRRYTAAFYLNATSFMASVALIIILLNPSLYGHGIRCHALCVCMVAGLLSLMGAYAAGSSRHVRTSIFMIALVALVFIFIILLLLIVWFKTCAAKDKERSPEEAHQAGAGEREMEQDTKSYGDIDQDTEHKYLMLLGILAASVTYQGPTRPASRRRGNSRRYHIFFLCNSTSFMASVLVITLLLLVKLVIPLLWKDHQNNGTSDETWTYGTTKLKFPIQAAHGMTIVDLLGLLGAYAAGSSREWETFGYIVALVAAVPCYIIEITLFNLQIQLLSTTHAAKRPSSTSTRRASWRPSLIILLVNPNLYRAGINCRALYVCMVAGLFGLMGAYPAGSTRHVRISIFMIALVALVFIFVILLLIVFKIQPQWIEKLRRKLGDQNTHSGRGSNDQSPGNNGAVKITEAIIEKGNGSTDNQEEAPPSVTYQAGLAPPGGVWLDNNDGHAVGNPVLHDSDHLRYRIFFVCNSASFAASMVVITLVLLTLMLKEPETGGYDEQFLVLAAESMMVVDLIGLLGAYAAGSSREWETSSDISWLWWLPWYSTLESISSL
ncbi:hypothetical protein U9M48_001770 [Paspalum notatum var. saurae]|uniref:PGG domain-containing protein n=1 Tax=Paspalum notatum var. saurae TaxID=547442 RepID=A0AAQ3PQ21_PASNO